jgi:hypothetical protein
MVTYEDAVYIRFLYNFTQKGIPHYSTFEKQNEWKKIVVNGRIENLNYVLHKKVKTKIEYFDFLFNIRTVSAKVISVKFTYEQLLLN